MIPPKKAIVKAFLEDLLALCRPTGTAVYEKSFKEDDQNGIGAVAYDDILHPYSFLDFGLKKRRTYR
jgi:hypothetical protein